MSEANEVKGMSLNLDRMQLLLPAPVSECSFCGESLSHIYEETSFGPQVDPRDGSSVCDNCWHDHFEFECIRCGNYDDADKQDRYLVIIEECGGMKSGIYRTTGPYFTSDYFNMWWNPWNLSRIKDADGDYYGKGEYPSGHLCGGCRFGLGLVEPTTH